MSEELGPVYVTALSRRKSRLRVIDPIRGPEDIHRLLQPLMKDADREHFYGIYLNARNAVIEVRLISMGSLNASIVHPREVFKPAVAMSAAALVIAHNHPSGQTDPSDDDLALTRRLVQVGELLGISIIDHLIVTNGSFISFKQQGYI